MFPGLEYLGRTLLILGIVLALFGGAILLVGKVPFLGRLPGDIVIQRKTFSLYFPLTTSIVVSILLTLLFFIFRQR